MPLILAQRRQRQADLEFEASLVYRENCRTAKATQKTLFQIKIKIKTKPKIIYVYLCGVSACPSATVSFSQRHVFVAGNRLQKHITGRVLGITVEAEP